MVFLGRTPIPYSIQTLLTTSIPVLITIFANLMQSRDFILNTFQLFTCGSCKDVYDFIIIGGGSAGTVIAARLSEDPAVKILLIEAGGNPNPITYIPFVAPAISQPEIDWGYYTIPMNGTGFGLKNRELFWPRGKSLGGSSNNNFMIYMRGNPNDFDNWATITGDSKWAYSNVEKIFRRIEDYHGNWDDGSYHGKGGPLRVEGLPFDLGLQPVLDAAREIGFQIKDPNSYQTQLFSPIDFTQKRGVRFSNYLAYIKPSKNRRNLIIHRYSYATKIHFDSNRKAVGVTYFQHGKEKYATATKEIIISGGAVNSPQLLMLSGIGPRNHLQDHGITPIVDLPGVGRNLQDHVTVPVGPFLINEPVSFLSERDFTFGSLLDYVTDGRGPVASPLTATSLGLLSTPAAPPEWPNIFYLFGAIGVSQGLAQLLTSFLGTTPQLFPDYFGPSVGRDAYFSWQSLALPKSRGEIRLKDGNPFSKPIIDPKYYSDERGEDLETMIQGMEFLIQFFENTTALGSGLGARLTPILMSGCENFERKTRAYYECFLKTVTLTLYHPAGSCAMGKLGDPGTVVDSQLRVVGVEGLRVADASIMPQITNANLNAPTTMIGEMCADIIKQSWSLN